MNIKYLLLAPLIITSSASLHANFTKNLTSKIALIDRDPSVGGLVDIVTYVEINIAPRVHAELHILYKNASWTWEKQLFRHLVNAFVKIKDEDQKKKDGLLAATLSLQYAFQSAKNNETVKSYSIKHQQGVDAAAQFANIIQDRIAANLKKNAPVIIRTSTTTTKPHQMSRMVKNDDDDDIKDFIAHIEEQERLAREQKKLEKASEDQAKENEDLEKQEAELRESVNELAQQVNEQKEELEDQKKLAELIKKNIADLKEIKNKLERAKKDLSDQLSSST